MVSRAGGETVAVVGAGPGGLASAMLLAARGVRVRIYEAQPRVGGRTGRIVRDGFSFDRGPTFFLMPYVLEEIFAAGGRRLADYVELTRLDPMYRLVIGSGNGPANGAGDPAATTIDCTQDVERMTAELARLDPRDAARFPEFLVENRRKLAAFTPVLRKPFRTLRDLLDPSFLPSLPLLRPWRSVHGDLAARFRDPRVRLALSFQSKYLGMSPMDCPSLFTILPLIEYEYGVWHPTGGCAALTDAMATACAEMGVAIECGAPVEAIEFDGQRAVGVRVRGESRKHDHVLVNADASWAIKSLVPPRLRDGGWSDERLDSMRYSCSTFMLYLGLRRRVDLPHHTIYVSSQYRRNLEDISARGCLSEDASTYVCHPTATDPGMAPPGCSSLYVLVPTPNLKCGAGVDWAAARATAREAALDRVATLCGRDIRGDIAFEECTTPKDWAAMNINFGATFNLAHNLRQMLHLRPQHEVAGLRNVWLAGGGTHPGSGLPVIFLSAQIAAGRLCERLGVPA